MKGTGVLKELLNLNSNSDDNYIMDIWSDVEASEKIPLNSMNSFG